MLSVTFAHERMHLLNHVFFPNFRLQNTPPGIGDGESGWALEEELFGGHVRITWSSAAKIGVMDAIERVTLKTMTLEKSGEKTELEFLLGLYVTFYCCYSADPPG